MRPPHNAEARRLCNEGYASLESGRFDEALALLTRACSLAPDNPLVHFRLALVFMDTGRPVEALASLDTSLALQSDNARAHNNRGSALQMLGRVAEAESAFRRALDFAPDLEQPYINLGHLLEKQGKAGEAIALYEGALARGLDAELFGHHLAAAMGKATARAPDRWVRATFDNFAPTFDERLRALGYDVPRKLAAMLQSRVTGPLSILDLGCGTGQCGLSLAHLKGHLTGVDLSEKMLVQARTHGVYDDLRVGEAETWLSAAATASYDVVIAADLFIYIGALEVLFREVARTLRAGAWFAFSTEECATGEYQLLSTGRYAQSHAYIRRLAAIWFAVAAAEPTVIRTESDVPLGGRLYLLQRSSTTAGRFGVK